MLILSYQDALSCFFLQVRVKWQAMGILALDIDGTLTDELKWVAPEVVDYLHQLSERGWKIGLVTGRIFSFSWEILKAFPFPYLLGVQNGADILEMPKKKPIDRFYFSSSCLQTIRAHAGDRILIYAGIDEGDFCYFNPKAFNEKEKHYLKKLESLGARSWKKTDLDFLKGEFPLIKCFGDQESMQRLHDRLQGNPDFEVIMIRDPVDETLYLTLITHPMANKGTMVDFLRQHFQESFVIAAGNDYNDLKMLKKADLAIAIETAPEEVLAASQIRALPARKLGIITALEEAISRASC